MTLGKTFRGWISIIVLFPWLHCALILIHFLKFTKKPKLDIITHLLHRDMGFLVQSIFSYLNETEIINATENPNWSEIVAFFLSFFFNCKKTERKTVLLKGWKNAPLSALYRRREFLAKETRYPLHPSKIFQQACIDCSRLSKFFFKRDSDSFRILSRFVPAE